MHTTCLFCGNPVRLVFVHGHYQCPVCKTNALPCCDGDNCNNILLSNISTENSSVNNQEGPLPGSETSARQRV